MGTDIVITEDVWGTDLERLQQHHTVARLPDAWRDRRETLRAARGARVLVVRNRTRVDEELLAASPRLGLVARAGAGLDNIDLAAARSHGVQVIAAGGVNARSVAEHAIGLALALARRTTVHDRAVRAGRWERTPGVELDGRTWGVLGFGPTGFETARLAQALSLRVLVHDPYVQEDDPRLAEAGSRRCTLEELRAAAQVLSIHVPLTSGTRGMIGASFLRGVRSDLFLINVARGEVVDEQALAVALQEGRLAGAALDVRAEEPPTPGVLETLDRVVLTPHVGGLTTAAQEHIVAHLARQIERYLGGEDRLAGRVV